MTTNNTETVNTAQLNAGDILQLNGCTMQLGPINERQDDTNGGAYGLVRWSKATVLEQHDATIPQAWFDRDEAGRRTWQVQGNNLATWQRVKR